MVASGAPPFLDGSLPPAHLPSTGECLYSHASTAGFFRSFKHEQACMYKSMSMHNMHKRAYSMAMSLPHDHK